MDVSFVPVDSSNAKTYISVGKQSSTEHYLHLWENADPSPFINKFLSMEGLLAEIKDPSTFFFMVQHKSKDVGILNFTLDATNDLFPNKTSLLLNKLYLIRSASNKGIGKATLKFTEKLAKTHKKDIVWLYAMKKGIPKVFYQKNGYKIISEATITLPHVLDDQKEMWVMAKSL